MSADQRKEVNSPPSLFDPDFEVARISQFVTSSVQLSHSEGIVIGISGGVDSAVTAAICVKALGTKRVTGLLLFEDTFRDSNDYKDAIKVCDKLGINRIDAPISTPVNAVVAALRGAGVKIESRLALGNIKARMRMLMLYSLANQRNLLVVGTGDRSEALIGYFTKFGDGGADIFPIGHLYKTEVRKLVRRLDLPESIASKPSSPNLWQGHKASDELPADYEVLDPLFLMLFDQAGDPDKVGSTLHIPKSTIDHVIHLNLKSEHKRRFPKMLAR